MAGRRCSPRFYPVWVANLLGTGSGSVAQERGKCRARSIADAPLELPANTPHEVLLEFSDVALRRACRPTECGVHSHVEIAWQGVDGQNARMHDVLLARVLHDASWQQLAILT